jgi:hypothetical protein
MVAFSEFVINLLVLFQQANSLHGSLLAPTAQSSRDFDISFSQLVTSQAMPTKYMASVPSTSGSTISVQEVLLDPLYFKIFITDL